MRRRLGWAFALASLAAVTARAGLDVAIGNGDVVRGTLLPATETETFRVSCPAGAKLTAALRSGKAKSSVVLRVVDPDGVDVGSKAGRSVRLRGIVVGKSGEHRVIVTSLDRATSDDYALSVAWKSPRRSKRTSAVEAKTTATFEFSADAGADVTLKVAAARKSHAAPSVVRVTGANGFLLSPLSGPKATFRAPAADTYTLTFENAADVAGDVTASAGVTPPKPRNRKLAATTREIPAGTTIVAAVVMDKAGGTLAAPANGALAGSRVTIPAKALDRPAIVVIGTAPDVTPRNPLRSTRATSAALVGPFGRKLAGPATATIVLPYDTGASVPGDTSLRVYAVEDASNFVDQITATSLDAASARVSFAATTFGRFQGYFYAGANLSPPATSAGATGDNLGSSVAVAGDWAYAGAPGAAGPGGEAAAGVVRAYQRVGDEWVERSPIWSPSPQAGERFGENMVLLPGVGAGGAARLVVAAPHRTVASSALEGAVDVFEGSGATWTLDATLAAPAGADSALFGTALAADGDTIVATASREIPDIALAQGVPPEHAAWLAAVRSFRRTAQGWTLEQTLDAVAENAVMGTFGWSLAVRGDDLFVGVPIDIAAAWPEPDAGARDSIRVYARVGGVWTATAMLREPPSVHRFNAFGRGIAVDGDTVVTGSVGVVRNSGIGALYLGARSDGWAPNTRFDGPFSVLGPNLEGGFSVAMRGGAFVAASFPLSWVYVYRIADGAWTQAGILDAAKSIGGFGGRSRVAFDGTVIVVGGPDARGGDGGIAIFPAP